MDIKAARDYLFPKKRTGRNISHTSFWMNPLSVEFIRNASECTRMPQGTILEVIINYYRLTRKKADYEAQGKRMTERDEEKLKNVYYFLRVLPY